MLSALLPPLFVVLYVHLICEGNLLAILCEFGQPGWSACVQCPTVQTFKNRVDWCRP